MNRRVIKDREINIEVFEPNIYIYSNIPLLKKKKNNNNMKEKLDQGIIFEYFHHNWKETKKRKYPSHVKYSGIK